MDRCPSGSTFQSDCSCRCASGETWSAKNSVFNRSKRCTFCPSHQQWSTTSNSCVNRCTGVKSHWSTAKRQCVCDPSINCLHNRINPNTCECSNCTVRGQSYKSASACHTSKMTTGCRCTDNDKVISVWPVINAANTYCRNRCPNGTFRSSDCTCHCGSYSNKSWSVVNNNDIVVTNKNESCCENEAHKTRWDESSQSCKCPGGKTEHGNLCCNTCFNGYASYGSCTCRQVVTPTTCPTNRPCGSPPNCNAKLLSCPNGVTMVCNTTDCPTVPPCSGSLIRCANSCVTGKLCPGSSEKVCPSVSCSTSTPTPTVEVELATPATCE